MAAESTDAEIVPYARDWDRAEKVDPGIVKRLGGLGFLGLMLPEEYGGADADTLSYALVTEELGRGDSSVRGIVSVSLGLVAKTIAGHGTDEQKERRLPRLADGDAPGCFALTEPGTGSDASSPPGPGGTAATGGGYGFIDEYPAAKYVRARVLTLYEGTSQVQKLIIGRGLTGVNAMA